MKKNIKKSLVVLVALGFFAMPVFAQKSNPKVPIDGGLSILLAAGAGYGAKKLYGKKKDQ